MADVTCGWGISREGLEGDTTSSRVSLAFCDDFRGGGLGARLLRFFSLVFPTARTVELDEDEVDNSRTAARPCGSEPKSFDMLPALLRVTGGRVRVGSACRILEPGGGMRKGAISPGDCDEMEVGVVSRLYGPGPGDSDHLVDGLPLKALI